MRLAFSHPRRITWFAVPGRVPEFIFHPLWRGISGSGRLLELAQLRFDPLLGGGRGEHGVFE